jgi:hypothetical protein
MSTRYFGINMRADRVNARHERIWAEAKRLNPEMFGMNRLATDEKTVAERQWQKPKLAPKPQQPCDHGLFSDEAMQLDLVEILKS